MYYFDPLDPTVSLAMPPSLVAHARQPILTSRTHIPSPQGSPGDAKIGCSLIMRDTHNERGQAVECSRSSLAMPHRKPFHRRA